MTLTNGINRTNISKINLLVFSSSTTYSPGPLVEFVTVVIQGGGGGSGGLAACAANEVAFANSGSTAGPTTIYGIPAPFTVPATITIGAGGAAGASGANPGGNGGNTSFNLFTNQGGLGSAGGAASVAGGFQLPPLPGGTSPISRGSPTGVRVFSGRVAPMWGSFPSFSGYANAGRGQINFFSSGATAGNAGEQGIVYILEYLR